MLIKNKAPDYLDNKMIDIFETEIREKAHEAIGDQMMFDVCEHLRERISDINDTVLDKFNAIKRAEDEARAEELAPKLVNLDDNLNYTPVNAETFAKWCSEFLVNLRAEEEANKTEQDLRKTGKELFAEMESREKGDIGDIDIDEDTLAEVLDDNEEAKEGDEEFKYEDDAEPVQEGALYDKDLFAQELGEMDDDDIDFD